MLLSVKNISISKLHFLFIKLLKSDLPQYTYFLTNKSQTRWFEAYLREGTGYEARQTSKEQKKTPRFMLEGPRPCTILFRAHTLRMNYPTKLLLVSFSTGSKQLLCFVQGQDQKSEQKHTTKSFDEFHNHSPLLHVTMLEVLSVTFICLPDNFICK